MKNKRGAAIIEYAMLIIMVLLAIMVFRHYFVGSLGGKHKSVGDTFGFGRQYDKDLTVACAWDQDQQVWYDEVCFDNGRQRCAYGKFFNGKVIADLEQKVECEKRIIKSECVTKACHQQQINAKGSSK